MEHTGFHDKNHYSPECSLKKLAEIRDAAKDDLEFILSLLNIPKRII